mgnify:CR=1 FL=1
MLKLSLEEQEQLAMTISLSLAQEEDNSNENDKTIYDGDKNQKKMHPESVLTSLTRSAGMLAHAVVCSTLNGGMLAHTVVCRAPSAGSSPSATESSLGRAS